MLTVHMRPLCTFVAALALAAFPWSALADKAADDFERVLRLIEKRESVPVLQFDDKHLQEMRIHGWKVASRESLSDNSEFVLALAVIGDPVAYRNVVEKVLQDPTQHLADALVATGDPRFLPSLAPALFVDEEFQVFGTDSKWYPRSYEMTGLMISIISNSSYFSDAVVNWARRFEGGFYSKDVADEWRGIVRAWWKENGEVIRRGDFAAVQPGKEPTVLKYPKILGTIPYPPVQSMSHDDGSVDMKVPSTSPPQNPRDDSSSSKPRVTVGYLNTPPLLMVACAAGLLALALWILSRRR